MESNYYAIIPATVRYDKNLTASAKLLYAEITSLTHKTGYCYATNEYFAELYGVNQNTVREWMSQLEKAGYINREIVYKENTKEVSERRIRIFELPPLNFQPTPPHDFKGVNNKYMNIKLEKKEKEIYKEKENGFVSDFEQGSKFEMKVENLEEKNPNTNQTYIRAQFEEWWSYFPKQRAGSKERAYKKYLNAVKKDKLTPEWLLDKIKEYAASEEVKTGFACGGARYFNDCKYNNHYSKKQADLNYLEQSLQELGL